MPISALERQSIVAGNEIEYCFEHENCEPLVESISAMCATNEYLNSMISFFNCICSKRERNNKVDLSVASCPHGKRFGLRSAVLAEDAPSTAKR